MKAVRIDLTAWRHVPWGGASGDQDIVILGLNWSTATCLMQVRDAAGDTGTPLVSLTNALAGAEGISLAYDAGYIHPTTGAVVGATSIRPQINQNTLEAIPLPSEASDPLSLAWDLQLTVGGLPKLLFAYGQFTLFPGVTY
ncbi:MAG TPA: hypothetical protein VN222_10610 [Novosphingobium sp.]|nr:hypothetical protein [Novosphingobium sp.]